MGSKSVCDYCGEEITGASIHLGDKAYCCQACAFEVQRSVDCGGRTDSPISRPIVEKIQPTSSPQTQEA